MKVQRSSRGVMAGQRALEARIQGCVDRQRGLESRVRDLEQQLELTRQNGVIAALLPYGVPRNDDIAPPVRVPAQRAPWPDLMQRRLEEVRRRDRAAARRR